MQNRQGTIQAVIGVAVLWTTMGAASAQPVGTVMAFAGKTAPGGFLMCDGSAVDRKKYGPLFNTIGTTYGAGDGSTTFNLPDLRGRVAFGKDDMGGTAAGVLTSAGSGVDGKTLGAVGGSEDHVLTMNEMPTHSHGVLDGGHKHGVQLQVSTQPSNAYGSSLFYNSPDFVSYGSCGAAFGYGCPKGILIGLGGTDIGSLNNAYYNVPGENADGDYSLHMQSWVAIPSLTGTGSGTSASATSNVSVGDAGGGAAHPTVPPATILNYIIKN